MGEVLRRLEIVVMAVLLQGCIAPNATLSFVPVTSQGSGLPALNTLAWGGPTALILSTCVAYTLSSEDATGVPLVTTSPLTISIGSSSGAYYSNSACTILASGGTLVLPTGSSSITVYFKSTVVGGVFLQAWAQNYALSTLDVPVSAVAAVASRLVFTTEPPAAGVSAVAFTPAPVVQIEDISGNLVSTANNPVFLAAYQDSSCSTLASSGSLNMNSLNASGGIASFSGLLYTVSSSSAIYLKATASGLTADCSSAVIITGGSIVAVATSSSSACALSNAGSVYCWGDNDAGQLGIGSTTTTGIPTQVVGVGGTGVLSSVSSISGGGSSFCAVASGHVYCWGNNSSSQLGNNTSTSSSSPVEVVGTSATGFLSGMASVSVGYAEACALSSDAHVYCWGMGSNGELGDGATGTSGVPVEVLGVAGSGVLSGVTSLSSGMFETCAVASSSVYCWGASSEGDLGNNNNSSSVDTPIEVLGVGGVGFLSGITSVSVNSQSVCAVASGGNLYCWGNDGNGQLGVSSQSDTKSTPVEVLGVGSSGVLSGIIGVSNGSSDSTCAVSSLGSAYCWGANGLGELGTGTNAQSTSPASVFNTGGSADLSGATSVSVGGSFACAVVSGHAYCWGDNSVGELGQATTGGDYSLPHAVLGQYGSGYL